MKDLPKVLEKIYDSIYPSINGIEWTNISTEELAKECGLTENDLNLVAEILNNVWIDGAYCGRSDHLCI